MSQARPTAWWRQARNDLDLAVVASRNGFHAQACFFATQAAEKALKGAIVELGLAPPHTHGLPKLVEVLAEQGVDASGLANLPLRALTRMTVTSRYPLEDTAPMDLFEPSDSQQAISTATAVLAWVERLDQGDGAIGVVPVDLDPIRAFRGSGAGGGTARLLQERQLDRRKEDG